MPDRGKVGIFHSPESRADYFDAYDALLAEWPVPSEGRMVTTRLGPTHVLSAGPVSAPPLVLLPAVSVSAAAWFANVGALARRYRIHAVDLIGDAGKSTMVQRPTRPADYADWLLDVFAGLGLSRPRVAGHSYGAWLTLILAAHAPDAVDRIAVMAPASGLAPFHWYTATFLRLAERLPYRPSARQTLQMQAGPGFQLNETFVRLMEAVMRDLRTDMLFPGPLSDEELGRIKAPTLVLVGDREVLYDPDRALTRARQLIPRAKCELVPGAGHLLIMEKPDFINARVADFLRAPALV